MTASMICQNQLILFRQELAVDWEFKVMSSCRSEPVIARSAEAALAARGLGALLAESGAGAFRQMSNSAFSFGGGCRCFDIFPGRGALFCGCHSAEKMTFIHKKGIGFTTQILLVGKRRILRRNGGRRQKIGNGAISLLVCGSETHQCP